jgi:hypothetical protein
MKDNPDVRWCKQQISRTLADFDARLAAAPSGPAVLEPTRPAPEKRTQRRRCDARIKHSPAALDRARRAGPATLRKYLRRDRCRNWALPGSKRCRLHGGHSTGPVTPEGKSRTVAAMKAGRARWIAKLKSEGKPIPCGRKRGGHNRSIEDREQAIYEKQCMREWRNAFHEARKDRNAGRRLAARRDRFFAANLSGPKKNGRGFSRVASRPSSVPDRAGTTQPVNARF